MGKSVADAAAWCGVGTRFLLDLELAKPNLQMDLALGVASKFGIRLELDASTIAVRSPTEASWQEVFAPADCQQPTTWLALYHAALYISRHIGLPTLDFEPVRDGRRLRCIRVNTGPWRHGASDRLEAIFPSATHAGLNLPIPWSSATADAAREECGGPGLADAIALLKRSSEMPLLDTELLVRWTVLTGAILDHENHIGRLRVIQSASGKIRLAPLGEILCTSSAFTSRPHRGLRIGNAWPEIYLRADHWKRFAEIAGVHPKTIFQMMRDIGKTVPGLLERAFEESIGEIPRMGPLIESIKNVRLASNRMLELSQAAARHVAGLTTKVQPKTADVPTRLIIAQPKRFHPVSDEYDGRE